MSWQSMVDKSKEKKGDTEYDDLEAFYTSAKVTIFISVVLGVGHCA